MKRFNLYIILILLSSLVYAQHSTSEDITSWYKIQTGTGLINCGPATLAMLIERSGPATTVGQMRNQLPDGRAEYPDLLDILDKYRIYYRYLERLSDWNGEGVVLLLVNTALIPERPYDYDGEHYILLVGENDDNYIVNDSYIGLPLRYYTKQSIARARYWFIIWIP